MPADDIGHGECDAAVRHQQHLGAGRVDDRQRVEVWRRADAGVTGLDRVGLGLRIGDEFLDVLDRQLRIDDDGENEEFVVTRTGFRSLLGSKPGLASTLEATVCAMSEARIV